MPLYTFKYVYDYVMTSPKSFVDRFEIANRTSNEQIPVLFGILVDILQFYFFAGLS